MRKYSSGYVSVKRKQYNNEKMCQNLAFTGMFPPLQMGQSRLSETVLCLFIGELLKRGKQSI